MPIMVVAGHKSLYKNYNILWVMLNSAPGALVKHTKKGNKK
jgi:hypothetical protein